MAPTSKAVAGFHMLMILSRVDGNFDAEESQVAARYISGHFPEQFILENETTFLKKLSPKNYFSHFKQCMDYFYRTSSATERAGLVKFAMEMINADREISIEENSYLMELLNSWEPEHTG